MFESVLYLARHAIYDRHTGRVVRLLGIRDRFEDVALCFLGVSGSEKRSGDGIE